MNAETVTLTTLFESDPEYAAVPERYLAGFRDLSGKSWGATVPLDAEEEVRRVDAREERTWTVAMYDLEGLVHTTRGRGRRIFRHARGREPRACRN